jgi:tetratricopeptide (TPR) repeat protein
MFRRFRRSLSFLFAAVLLALVAAVFYAVLRFRGPEQELAEAQALLDRREYASVVARLDLAESSGSLRNDRALLRRLWTIRRTAHKERNNAKLQLDDVERLLEGDSDPAEKLQLERIELLCRVDRAPEALAHARRYVESHPDDGAGLELAGSAAQLAYQESLGRIREQVRSDVDKATNEAEAPLLGYLYRPAGDPGVQNGMDSLRMLYASQARLSHVWQTLEGQIRELRHQIQESLDFFRRSMEAGGTPIASFRGLAWAFAQSGRYDDVIALCETYMRRYDHVYVADAAAEAARVHLATGQWDAAIDVADRFLPEAGLAERLRAQRLDHRVQDLLVSKSYALWQKKDIAGLSRQLQTIHYLFKNGVKITLADHYTSGLHWFAQNNQDNARPHLLATAAILATQPPPPIGPDLLLDIVPLRLQLLRRMNAKDQEVREAIASWQNAKGRTGSVLPWKARTRYEIDTGQYQNALIAAVEAARIAPQDESCLQLLAEAAERNFRESGNQDGEGLLLACVQRKTKAPDVPHPVCYLLCAEAALRHRETAIARECARLAADKFPWSRWPRLLEAKAELLANRPGNAVNLLGRLLGDRDYDRETLSLWLEASRQAGSSLQAHLFDALRICPPDSNTAVALLRAAILDSTPEALSLASRAATLERSSTELLALTAKAFAQAQNVPAAQATLARARAAIDAGTPEQVFLEVANAAAAILVAMSDSTSDQDLEREAELMLQNVPCLRTHGPVALQRAARELGDRGRTRAAYALASAAVAASDAEQARTGKAFLLAGLLALELGNLQVAEEHLLAAISFPDAGDAAEPLARLLVRRGSVDRATQALQLAVNPADPALLLRLGETAKATTAAADALQRDPGDLLAHSAIGMLPSAPAEALAAELATAAPEQRMACFEILSLLTDKSLAAEALARSIRLHEELPDSPTVALIRARALVDTGNGRAAAGMHQRLFDGGFRHPILFAEVVRGVGTKGYVADRQLRDAIRLEATRTGAPPAVVAFATREAAAEFRAGGNEQLALQLLTDLWLQMPGPAGARLADAILLHRRGQAAEAFALLQALRDVVPPDQQQARVEAMFAVAQDLSARGERDAADRAREAALECLNHDGVSGAPLHFLLADDHQRTERLDDEQVHAWLRAHLDLCASGKDRWSLGLRSVDALLERFGAERTLQDVEATLRRHPAALPLWPRRSEILVLLQRPQQAIADLRAFQAHADAPALTMATIQLAAEQRQTLPTDIGTFLVLPEAMRTTPAGLYVAGLLALRAGRAAEAAPWLERAEPQATGAHLYFRALAALCRGDRDETAIAARLFAQLENDYPSSSWARHAGSFARQLATR